MNEKRFEPEAPIDGYTWILVALALKIADAAQAAEMDYALGEGIGLAIGLGEITRNHGDIDFHPLAQDVEWWKAWFAKKGYEIKPRRGDDYPEAYKVVSEEGRVLVDVWPVHIQNGRTMFSRRGELIDTEKEWGEIRRVDFQGHVVRVENPRRIIEQKIKHSERTGEPLRPQDSHDLAMAAL